MAIIHTFEQCLESPYLFEDDQAPGRVSELVAQAQGRIDMAEEIAAKPSGRAESVEISYLSHQAMFCYLRARVYAKGYRDAGLKCLLAALSALYIKPGQLDAEFTRSFEAAQSLKASPSENLRAARSLLSVTRGLLSL